jgi:hypothetical protein
MSWVGCSRTLPHDFDPRKAHDHADWYATLPSDAADLETLAVLLIPSNTTLSRAASSRAWGPDIPDELRAELFVGPARVFLRPGKTVYKLDVRTSDGVAEFELDVELEAGKRYELAIVENGDDVRFDLFELHESSYAALYPNE